VGAVAGASDLGLNPQPDGDLLRIPVPPLSEQRRKELVKVARRMGEDHKVTVRKARHECLDMLAELKQSGEASEDQVERAKKKAEELVVEAGHSIDQVVQAKEKDILTV
jgi:ribosome recycling factor